MAPPPPPPPPPPPTPDDREPPRWQRAFVIAACAVIGGAFAYAASDWGQWPRLAYLPVRGTLTVTPVPAGTIAMVYPGLVAWGLGGAVTGALVGALGCAVMRRRLPDRALIVLGAWALCAVALAALYFTWTLWPR